MFKKPSWELLLKICMYDLISIGCRYNACFPQAKTVLFYCDGVFIVIFFQTIYNKTIIRMVFAISRIIKVELSVNQPWPSPQLECLVIKITRPHSRPFLVSTWYRPPSSSQDIFSRFEILVDKIDSENNDFYLLEIWTVICCTIGQTTIFRPV